jgi:Fe-S-cluster containining protein
MRPVQLPDKARFSCQSCGRCCQGWAVPVDQATVDRLRGHDWGGEPFERVTGAGEPYRIRLVENRCFFLDPQNRCRIHAELAYDAKPPVCRSFPLTVLEVAGQRYARLSFWCPTVTANVGKSLDYQSTWIKETSKHADRRTAPLMLNEKTEVQPADFDRIHHALRRFLVDPTLPVADRLAAASALIRRLDRAPGKVEGAAVAGLVRAAESDSATVLAAEGRRGGRASGGRRVLSLYLLQDRQGGRIAIVVRLAAVLLFNAGLTSLSSRAVPCAARWRQVRRVSFAPSAASLELLTRYFCSKLDSRRYVAGEATLVAGFNLLVAAYGTINVLARMRAASQGRTSCSDEDIALAVGAADLLVVEHPGLHYGRVHAALVDAALGGSGMSADLLALIE